MGFAVDVADNGETALEALLASLEAAAPGGARAYDLLVTDCHMPRMDGVALTQAVRTSPSVALRALPVVGLTADATETQRERCREAGMTELAIKPMMAEQLRALVARVLPSRVLPSHVLPSHVLPSHVLRCGPDVEEAPKPAAPPRARLRDVAFDDQIYREIFPVGDPDGDVAGRGWLTDFLAAAREEDASLAGLLASAPGMLPNKVDLATVAHRLAGASFSVGAMRLGRAASILENAANRHETAVLVALHDDVHAELLAAAAAIAEFLAAPKAEMAA
jgi:CheY-like chemotaxis protein